MASPITAALLNYEAKTWDEEIDRLRTALGAPNNPDLFPPHFLKSAFPKIGGRIVTIRRGEALLGAGFLFPRALANSRREFTMRLHRIKPNLDWDRQQVQAGVEARLKDERVVLYEPQSPHTYERTGQNIDGLEVGHPDAAEAAAIRAIQQKIWGSEPDFLYPADLHADDFRAATSLVVRAADRRVISFLFGFYKFSTEPLPPIWRQKYQGELRVESQVLGVLPGYRGRGLGTLLKRCQAEKARQEGIDVINWTVDPLLYGNAVLNFGFLRSVAFRFYPAHYTFKNALNQVPASRLEIVWLVNSDRVQRALTRVDKSTPLDLSTNRAIRKVNRGWNDLNFSADAPHLAFEIPAQWAALQKEDPAEALRWRETTDTLFQHYLGVEEGRYLITDVGTDAERTYLIAERVDPALLARLAR